MAVSGNTHPGIFSKVITDLEVVMDELNDKFKTLGLAPVLKNGFVPRRGSSQQNSPHQSR